MHTKIELGRLGMKPKFSEFIKTESDGSDKEAEEQEPVAKIIQKLTSKATKFPKLANTDPEDSDNDN